MGLTGPPDSSRAHADIHPTAIVHPAREIGAGTVVGPYVTIGEHVTDRQATAGSARRR